MSTQTNTSGKRLQKTVPATPGTDRAIAAQSLKHNAPESALQETRGVFNWLKLSSYSAMRLKLA